MTTSAPEKTDAERFRDRRLELGLTLEQVAQRAGCAYSTVIRFESGTREQERRRPAVDRIAAVLWPSEDSA